MACWMNGSKPTICVTANGHKLTYVSDGSSEGSLFPSGFFDGGKRIGDEWRPLAEFGK